MKICVYGAGSIGGVIGGVLAQVGHDVSLIARGAHLHALKANGCTVETGGQTFTVEIACSDNPADFGPQDYVVVAVKGPTMPSIAAGISPLLGSDTAVVPAMNGIAANDQSFGARGRACVFCVTFCGLHVPVTFFLTSC